MASSISSQDAAAALRDIQRAEARSARLADYHHAAPHFIIWGVLWAIGYALSHFLPGRKGAIWAVIVPIGLAAVVAAARTAGRGLGWRYGGAALAIGAFFAATFLIMAPVSDRQVAAFIPLVVALAYVLWGIWGGPRYGVAGVLVALLTLAGFFLVTEHFFLWMAGVGGGALILAGVWLRRV